MFQSCGFIFDTDKRKGGEDNSSIESLVLKADNWIKFFVRKCLKDIQFAHGG